MAEPGPGTGPVVEVENLVVEYDHVPVLRGVSLAVSAGEILVIMGGSGSGKSTLLRHLLGLERPTSGSVRILGRDVSQLSEREYAELARRIGVAFQGGALLSSLSVGENIMLPLREHTDLDERTMEIMVRLKLEVVSLAGFEALMPSELSGGMTKRAAFARAIIMDPAVAASLDELILRLRDAMRMSIIVVTHDLESAFRIADRIAVLDHGEILAVGSVEEVQQSENARIQDLLQRRFEEGDLDPEAYLARLTGEIAAR
jgi:phospholipid/cholesterol/gamma-HCH transport system ATP-binding protein